MGNIQSTPEYNPYTGTYEYNTGYQTDYERYYRSRMYPYNSYSPGYSQPLSYGYQQQYYNNLYSPYQYSTSGLGYGYGTPVYQQAAYNNVYGTPIQYSTAMYGTPTYGAYNNAYYPNYVQRSYMM